MHKLKLLDFKVYDKDSEEESEEDNNSDEEYKKHKIFTIQLFGINEKRETYSVFVENFKPYFYVKIPNMWDENERRKFEQYINTRLGNVQIKKSILTRFKKLYGFDGGKKHNFIKLIFDNQMTFNRVKSFWFRDGTLISGGIKFNKSFVELYEAQIPPLLRFFHENEISPSGWISIDTEKSILLESRDKTTSCDYEITSDYENIVSTTEDRHVPYKICSFDIEASSSHGDFPLPVKSYKKLTNEILEFSQRSVLTNENFIYIIKLAFGYEKNQSYNISKVYIKTSIDEEKLLNKTRKILEINLHDVSIGTQCRSMTIEQLISKHNGDYESDEEYNSFTRFNNVDLKKIVNIIDLLQNNEIVREIKAEKLNYVLTTYLPEIKGDIVTFIGSTFMNYGDDTIYKNHCLALNDCCDLPNVANSEVVCCKTEKELLIKWAQLIKEEDPDIIIGYNIFGFDYEFMFRRACEIGCVVDFLKTSRNNGEICGLKDKDSNYRIQQTNIVLASGQHDLSYINMPGRIQIDLYNYFRRDFNLESYKLDSVAGYFIGDSIKSTIKQDTETKIFSKNLSGLTKNSFIHIEEVGHTNEYLNNGAKYEIVDIDIEHGEFTINISLELSGYKSLRWCLAKDDVTPQDIFRLTNGTKNDRGIVAKYCIQDCNLVHSLLKKIDVITGFVEMAKLCSVPISFLVLRGQGIKLTSFISKKCKEKGTLMPVLRNSHGSDDGYEGAIVLEPKCNLYLESPVACVDYSSLYPSSMISENLCHSSKVWTKEYDLTGELIKKTGDMDKDKNFIYDNLPDYTYVDIEYDTYSYVRKSPKAAAQKIKCGSKICRFAESKKSKAILPAVLQELLSSRKSTKKQMANESDPFMKNILDKRQLSIKLTANSLYGQCGAKTSAFYEKDVAACTTATGRTLLIYAKDVIEGVYGDNICDTKNFGRVKTNAEYIYGDTDSVFFTFNLKHIDTNEPILGKDALEITIELAQQAGELATKFLKHPHDLEYEKTFLPFCLLSKKRYVGMLYEHDVNKCKSKSMGIVLKRRDNAPIVKDIYGGVIDILMKDKNIEKSLNFLDKYLMDIFEGKCAFEKFVISKSLRSGYKNPTQIAHKVLADRMGERDTGNKPAPGDRIQFAYIITPKKEKLQGNRIEHPTYIKEKNLKLDVEHYITNQIMKPIIQIYSLIIFDLPTLKKKQAIKRMIHREIEQHRSKLGYEAFKKKEEQIKNKYVQQFLFDKYIKMSENKKNNVKEISSYFKVITN
jgi:DNA polymerase elongation subunit (family B)